MILHTVLKGDGPSARILVGFDAFGKRVLHHAVAQEDKRVVHVERNRQRKKRAEGGWIQRVRRAAHHGNPQRLGRLIRLRSALAGITGARRAASKQRPRAHGDGEAPISFTQSRRERTPFPSIVSSCDISAPIIFSYHPVHQHLFLYI